MLESTRERAAGQVDVTLGDLIAMLAGRLVQAPDAESYCTDLATIAAPRLAADDALVLLYAGEELRALGRAAGTRPTGALHLERSPRLEPDLRAGGIVDLAEPPGWPELVELAPGAAQAVLFPFPSAGEPVGLLVALRNRPGALSDAERRTGRALADLAVAGVRLRESERVRARERRVRDDFISLVAHELKSPLTSVAGYSQILIRKPDLPAAKRQDHLQVILTEARRLTRLINDLRESLRWESGESRVQREPADLGTVIQDAVDRVPGSDSHRIVLDLPAAPCRTRVDAERIAQVLTILLANAVKYSPGASEIRVSACQHDGWVEVSVSDHGSGIAAADLPKLFLPFYRGQASNEAHGSGLGLHIARQIVEAHGGQIGVESRPGLGSTFSIRLPTSSE